LNTDSQCAKIGLINALRNNGLDFTLNSVISSNQDYNSTNNNQELSDIKYYTSWKLGIWDDMDKNVDFNEELKNVNFNKTFYDVLKLKTQNQSSFALINFKEKVSSLIHSCQSSLVEQLIDANCDNSDLIQKQARLYYLQEITTFTDLSNNYFDDMKPVLSHSIYRNFELATFSNNDQFNKNRRNKFYLFDDLLGLRLKMITLLTKSTENSLDDSQVCIVNKYKNIIYQDLVENAINYKFFQVILKIYEQTS
jgi:hypothetical protein